MTRNVRVRVPPPPGVTLIPDFITEEEEEVKMNRKGGWKSGEKNAIEKRD